MQPKNPQPQDPHSKTKDQLSARTVGLEEGEVGGVREFWDPRRLHLPQPTQPPGQVSHQLCACWLAQMSRGIEPRQEANATQMVGCGGAWA